MACTSGKCELSSGVRRLRDAGMEALREGCVEQAEELLRQSVTMSEAGGGVVTSTANSVYRLGLALWEAGRTQEAVREFEKALSLVRDEAGCENKLYQTILDHFTEILPSYAHPAWDCQVSH